MGGRQSAHLVGRLDEFTTLRLDQHRLRVRGSRRGPVHPRLALARARGRGGGRMADVGRAVRPLHHAAAGPVQRRAMHGLAACERRVGRLPRSAPVRPLQDAVTAPTILD